MAYLTYTEYNSLGGKVNEDTFNLLTNIVETKLDCVTFGRLRDFETIPDTVKLLIVRLVSVYNSCDYNRDESVKSYSNGIETITYADSSTSSTKGSTGIDDKVLAIIKEYLWEYPELFYRGRKKW